jgi:hypothetical protein
MSAKDKAFKAALFALMKEHGVGITWDRAYYDGESEDIRFYVEGGTEYLEIKDLSRDFDRYMNRPSRDYL